MGRRPGTRLVVCRDCDTVSIDLHESKQGDHTVLTDPILRRLLAATIGPLANVLSIAALVTYWRMCLVDDVDPNSCPWNGDENLLLTDLNGHTFQDPRWYACALFEHVATCLD